MRKIIIAALLCCGLLCGCSDASDKTDAELKKELGLTDAASESDEVVVEADGTVKKMKNISGLPDLKSFTALTLEGAEISESEFARADVTVINIWATTCPPCISEMPEIAELRASLPENVALMTWCLDAGFYPDETRDILNDAGFDGLTIASGEGDLAALGSSIMYTPTTIFVDSEGNIMGNAIIGAGNVTEKYTAKINNCLLSLGKEAMK